MTKRATLTKDYKYWKAGSTLGFPQKLYEELKKEGYFSKVKKVTKKQDSEG